MQSIKAVRFQIGEFYDMLFELLETSQIKSKAESLGNLMRGYKVLVTLVFWYDLLFQINFVSKELQSKSVDLSTALCLFEKILS